MSQTLTLKNIVIDGNFSYRELTQNEVKLICTEITSKIIRDVYGMEDFYYGFKNEDKSVNNGFYLSMVYGCCCHLLDYINKSKLNKKQKKSIYEFGISILDFIKKYDMDSPVEGGVDVWTRKGDCYAELNEYEKAIDTYKEGLEIFKNEMNWKPGMLTKNDNLLGLDRSKVEIILSRVVVESFNYHDYSLCHDYGMQLLNSIGIRGMDDLFSDNLPDGIRFMVEESEKRIG